MRSVSLLVRLGISWASTNLSAWHQTRETINELFDTQQMLLAKRLLTLDFSVVVGQESEYRDDIARDLMNASVLPWLIELPFMLMLLISLVWSELRPLKQLAQQLAQRAPDDGTPLQAGWVPKEVQPLIIALNGLFSRISAMMYPRAALYLGCRA